MIVLNRLGNGKEKDDTFTIGSLKTPNFKVFTLEDDYDEVKDWGHTRIPSGTYEIKLRTEGSTNLKYSKRFADIHKGMLELQNVPNYKYVLIHCGNSEEDTAGCILVGMKVQGNRLIDSTTAYRYIYKDILNEILTGKKVFIEIID